MAKSPKNAPVSQRHASQHHASKNRQPEKPSPLDAEFDKKQDGPNRPST